MFGAQENKGSEKTDMLRITIIPVCLNCSLEVIQVFRGAEIESFRDSSVHKKCLRVQGYVDSGLRVSRVQGRTLQVQDFHGLEVKGSGIQRIGVQGLKASGFQEFRDSAGSRELPARNSGSLVPGGRPAV